MKVPVNGSVPVEFVALKMGARIAWTSATVAATEVGVTVTAPDPTSAASLVGSPDGLSLAAIKLVTGVTLIVVEVADGTILISDSTTPSALVRAATITKGALALVEIVTENVPSAAMELDVPTTAPVLSVTVITPPMKAAPVAATPESVTGVDVTELPPPHATSSVASAIGASRYWLLSDMLHLPLLSPEMRSYAKSQPPILTLCILHPNQKIANMKFKSGCQLVTY